MDFLPFADLSGLELQNLFETGSDKLKHIINNSKLPKHINQLIPYFGNSVPGTNYYIEDKFNSYINKIRPRFSVFHLNISSLNCHHKELICIAYLHLLNLRFDCICLSEVRSTNLYMLIRSMEHELKILPIDISRLHTIFRRAHR